VLAAAALAAAALSCGDVPTFAGGIAYITPVLLPAPAVALGDTLRDSTGVATPLRVYAFDTDDDTISGITPLYLQSSLPLKGVRISPAGYVIGDSVREVQIVAQVGERLQTPPAPLQVVRQPDSLEAAAMVRTITFPGLDPGTSSAGALDVKVSSAAGAPRAGVRGIIVRYRISRLVPATAVIPDTLLVLMDDAGRFLGADGRTAVDTTDATGTASRRVRAVLSQFDSVEVTVTATNLRGVPLRGSPRRLVLGKKLE
jgi:hypothetical protein